MAENRIKELRNEAKPKITLKKLSEMLNEKGLSFTDSQLSKFEKGKSFPRNMEIWEALAEIFNVSVPYLKGDSDYKLKEDASRAYFRKSINNDVVENDFIFIIEKSIIEKYGEKTLKILKENMPVENGKLDNGSTFSYDAYTDFLYGLSYLNDDFSDILITLATLDEKKRKLIISFTKDII